MGEVLDAMFKSWPMYGAGREQVSALTLRYLKALREVPVWAVQAGIDRWGEGDWKLEFGESFEKYPSSATLLKMARHEMLVAENMLRSLEKIDAAVAEVPHIPPSPQERERMAAKFKALSEELGQRIAARALADRSWPQKERFDAEHARLRARQPNEQPAQEPTDA